jgi:hypothetical protein
VSKSNAFETSSLKLLFQNVAIAEIGDAAGLQPSAVAGFLYLSLHTADPRESGDQETNEAAYTSYARRAVARSGVGWTVVGPVAANAAAEVWPVSTGGDEVITHWAVGTLVTGTGTLLASGKLPRPLRVVTGIQPQVIIGAITYTED